MLTPSAPGSGVAPASSASVKPWSMFRPKPLSTRGSGASGL